MKGIWNHGLRISIWDGFEIAKFPQKNWFSITLIFDGHHEDGFPMEKNFHCTNQMDNVFWISQKILHNDESTSSNLDDLVHWFIVELGIRWFEAFDSKLSKVSKNCQTSWQGSWNDTIRPPDLDGVQQLSISRYWFLCYTQKNLTAIFNRSPDEFGQCPMDIYLDISQEAIREQTEAISLRNSQTKSDVCKIVSGWGSYLGPVNSETLSSFFRFREKFKKFISLSCEFWSSSLSPKVPLIKTYLNPKTDLFKLIKHTSECWAVEEFIWSQSAIISNSFDVKTE